MLVVAATVSFAIGEVVDGSAILAIVVLNAVVGAVQERRAERALEALRGMLAPRATAVRDGRTTRLDAADLVPGDVVVLAEGDRVPADLRLIEEVELRVDESVLTGESRSVAKDGDAVAPSAPVHARTSMVWMGTSVARGRARGLVVGTGMGTEFGRIARLTSEVETGPSLLRTRLAHIGSRLGLLATAVSAFVLLVGWLRGHDGLEIFLTAVSLAVAAVPEGLPAVVTLTLAIGVRSMARRNALLRRLSSAETPRVGDRHLQRQDRDPDPERDDGPADLEPRPGAAGHRSRLRAHGSARRDRRHPRRALAPGARPDRYRGPLRSRPGRGGGRRLEGDRGARRGGARRPGPEVGPAPPRPSRSRGRSRSAPSGDG